MNAVNFRFPVPAGNGCSDATFPITVVRDPGERLDAYPIPKEVRGRDEYVGYYWANQFGFTGTGRWPNGYAGLQTVGSVSKSNPDAPTDAGRNINVGRGRIAIYSVWNALDGRPGPANSNAAPFGHEGDGWSCKLKVDWREGVDYHITVRALDGAGSEPDTRWWRAILTEAEANTEQVIGDILVPADWGGLAGHTSTFTEYYSRTVAEAVADADVGRPRPRVCEFLTAAAVRLDPPSMNGGIARPLSMTARNYGKCAHVSRIETADGDPVSPGVRQKPRPLVVTTGSLTPQTPRP